MRRRALNSGQRPAATSEQLSASQDRWYPMQLNVMCRVLNDAVRNSGFTAYQRHKLYSTTGQQQQQTFPASSLHKWGGVWLLFCKCPTPHSAQTRLVEVVPGFSTKNLEEVTNMAIATSLYWYFLRSLQMTLAVFFYAAESTVYLVSDQPTMYSS